jgi:hypothetical protein
VLLREADLQHHLSVEDDKSAGDASAKGAKPTEKVIAGPATGKSAAAPAKTVAAAKEAKDAPKDPNAKDAKKEDLQLNAALNHLKGLPVLATATAAVTAK